MSKVEIQFSNGKIIGKKDVPILYDPNHKIYSGGYTIPNPALSSLNEKKLKNMLVENETVLLQYFWNLANKFEWSDQSEIDPAKIRKIVYLLTRPRIVKLTETITFDKALLVKEMMDLLITERLKELGSETKKFLSDKGKKFKMLHIQIRNFKNWIRGVHSYCNKEYLQKYIDEYFFRFNRRNHRKSILDKILERSALHQPVTIRQIKLSAT